MKACPQCRPLISVSAATGAKSSNRALRARCLPGRKGREPMPGPAGSHARIPGRAPPGTPQLFREGLRGRTNVHGARIRRASFMGGTCAWGAAAVAGPGAAVPLLPVMSGSLACLDAAIIRDAAGGCRPGSLACAAGWATKKAPCGHGASGVRDRGPSRRSDRSRASRPGRSSRAGRAPGRPRRTRPGPR